MIKYPYVEQLFSQCAPHHVEDAKNETDSIANTLGTLNRDQQKMTKTDIQMILLNNVSDDELEMLWKRNNQHIGFTDIRQIRKYVSAVLAELNRRYP